MTPSEFARSELSGILEKVDAGNMDKAAIIRALLDAAQRLWSKLQAWKTRRMNSLLSLTILVVMKTTHLCALN